MAATMAREETVKAAAATRARITDAATARQEANP